MAEKHILTIEETEEMINGEAADMLVSRFPLRYERSKQFMFREDALRCLAGGILMNSVLGIDESMLGYGQFGKPYIKDDAGGDVEFNISHSGRYIVMATASSSVGIDIEKIDPHHADLAEHVFTEEELKWMNDRTEDNGSQEKAHYSGETLEKFYILWTLKESLMKATGLGLNLPPKSFSVMDGIRDGLLLHDGMEYEMKYEKMGDYIIATCTQGCDG